MRIRYARFLLLLACLFYVGQRVSIAHVTEIVANVQAADDIDDLSLEDIVPVDPFIAGLQKRPSEFLGLSVQQFVVPLVLAILYPSPVSQSKSCLALHELHKQAAPRGKLWIVHRSLLI